MTNSHDQPTTLGNALRELREAIDLPIEVVAAAIDRSKSHLSILERADWRSCTTERRETLLRAMRYLRSQRFKMMVYDVIGKSGDVEVEVVGELLTAWETDSYLAAVRDAAAHIPALARDLGAARSGWLGSPDLAFPHDVGTIEPQQMWDELLRLRALMFQGRSEDRVQQTLEALLAVQCTDWSDSARGLELQAYLLLELGLAFHEALPVRRYRAIISAVKEARYLARELEESFSHRHAGQSHAQTVRDIECRGEWLLGMAERKLGEEANHARRKGDTGEAQRLARLRAQCLTASVGQGQIHPLVLALQASDVEVRLWAYDDLIKLHAETDFPASLRYAEDAAALLAANPSYMSHTWHHLRSVFYESIARAYVQNGPSQEAADHLNEARQCAVTALNLFEVDITSALNRWVCGVRDEAQHLLSQLALAPISPFQSGKIVRLATERGIVLAF